MDSFIKVISFLKLTIYGTMCIFMIGLLDVGHVTHDVFLASFECIILQ